MNCRSRHGLVTRFMAAASRKSSSSQRTRRGLQTSLPPRRTSTAYSCSSEPGGLLGPTGSRPGTRTYELDLCSPEPNLATGIGNAGAGANTRPDMVLSMTRPRSPTLSRSNDFAYDEGLIELLGDEIRHHLLMVVPGTSRPRRAHLAALALAGDVQSHRCIS